MFHELNPAGRRFFVMSTDNDTQLTKLLHTLRPLEGLSAGNLKELARHVNSIEMPADKMVFKRNQVNQYYYYLLDGKIELLDAQFQIQPLMSDDDRASAPLDTANPYQYSAISKSVVTLLKVSKDKLDLVLTWDQAGNYLVADVGEDDYLERDWMSCLLGSKLFQQIPPANLQQLFAKFNERQMKAGQRVITEGDQGDAFFVVQNGRVQVLRYQEAGRERQLLAELGPGEYFGEEALIGNTVRNASVEMITDGVLMELGKEDFKKLLEEPVVQYVTESELTHWSSLGKAYKLLDVRLPVEIVATERKNRLIITLADLRNHLQELDDSLVYVLCPEAGRRAVLGAYLLQQAGFKAVVQTTSAKIKN
jgi:hypothetical protein